MIGRTNAVVGKSGSKWPSADDVQVTYTGTMKDPREITDAAGNKYVLYELTSSGTLTVDKPVPVDICIVRGGQAGGSYDSSDYNYGGCGGAMLNTAVVLTGEMPCIVGDGGGVGLSYGQSLDMGGISTIEINSYTYSSDGYGSSIGTGAGKGAGGSSWEPNNSFGDGKTKYVFGDESVYSYPICAGGGGGVAEHDTSSSGIYGITRGGGGGSNGGNGEDHSDNMINPETDTIYWETWPYVEPSFGGYYGGGNGAGMEKGGATIPATDGFTYGSGGGGGRNGWNGSSWGGSGVGLGYQGVIFIRILK